MTEHEFLSMIRDMTDAEKRELMSFINFLHKCQDEGRTITYQEAYEWGVAARARIASQQ